MAKQIRYVTIAVTTINSKKFAVVPLEEYEAFVREQRIKVAQKRPRPTLIMQNAELEAYLEKALDEKPLKEVIADCRAKFGDGLPSDQAFIRHEYDRRRKRAEAQIKKEDIEAMPLVRKYEQFQNLMRKASRKGSPE